MGMKIIEHLEVPELGNVGQELIAYLIVSTILRDEDSSSMFPIGN
jgi:hypothetical protein